MKQALLRNTAISILAAGVALPAWAQTEQAQQEQAQPGTDQQIEVVREGVVGLDEWGYEGLYGEGKWTAQQLLDAEVFGPGGEEIGNVENILVGTGGVVEAIIAEVGGFWDIGDTHVRVPWAEVEASFENGDTDVQIPVTEETVEDYDVFGGVGGEFRVVDDDEPFTPRSWRATELIDDYVTLEGGARYGWVEDLLFDEGGRLDAVIVDAVYGGAYGPYAYPYYGYGYGFRPGDPYYGMPYAEEDIGALEPFDYEQFETAEATED